MLPARIDNLEGLVGDLEPQAELIRNHGDKFAVGGLTSLVVDCLLYTSERVKAFAKENGYELLFVWPSGRAVPFYERQGFRAENEMMECPRACE